MGRFVINGSQHFDTDTNTFAACMQVAFLLFSFLVLDIGWSEATCLNG
jgi:hypothetical protein